MEKSSMLLELKIAEWMQNTH